MRHLTFAIVAVGLTALAGGHAAAQSAKSTIGMSGTAMVVATEGSSHTLTPLTTKIHVPQGKELILDLSLEC